MLKYLLDNIYIFLNPCFESRPGASGNERVVIFFLLTKCQCHAISCHKQTSLDKNFFTSNCQKKKQEKRKSPHESAVNCSHTSGFNPQTRKLEPIQQHHRKLFLNSFNMNGHTVGFHP